MSLVLLAAVSASSGACSRTPKPLVLGKIVATPTPTPPSPSPSPVPLVVPSTRTQAPRPATVKARASVPSNLVTITWYGYGGVTASGEAYNAKALACAGASRFPMLSHWRLTNPITHASVVIKVNDRGAFEGWGRSFDCTPSVIHALGFALSQGVYHVEARAA